MSNVRKYWGKDEWLVAYCSIQPNVEAGTAAFNLAWNAQLGSTYHALQHYFEYLVSGQPVLSETELDTCVHNASVMNWPLEYVLERAELYKSYKYGLT